MDVNIFEYLFVLKIYILHTLHQRHRAFAETEKERWAGCRKTGPWQKRKIRNEKEIGGNGMEEGAGAS